MLRHPKFPSPTRARALSQIQQALKNQNLTASLLQDGYIDNLVAFSTGSDFHNASSFEKFIEKAVRTAPLKQLQTA